MTTKKYVKDDLTIIWKPEVCIHSKVCWQKATGLPEVFNPTVRPWISPENASKDAIVEQIKKCPSGALSFEFSSHSDSKTAEHPSKEITVSDNGPILINGEVKLSYKGETITRNNAALCRCGHSSNKPFCDGTHRSVDFKD